MSEPESDQPLDPGGDVVVVSESNNNDSASTPVIIGEPKDKNFNVNESVIWSHNWFRKSEDPQQGICLLCEADNAKLPATAAAKARKKKDAFSAVNWSTSGK